MLSKGARSESSKPDFANRPIAPGSHVCTSRLSRRGVSGSCDAARAVDVQLCCGSPGPLSEHRLTLVYKYLYLKSGARQGRAAAAPARGAAPAAARARARGAAARRRRPALLICDTRVHDMHDNTFLTHRMSVGNGRNDGRGANGTKHKHETDQTYKLHLP